MIELVRVAIQVVQGKGLLEQLTVLAVLLEAVLPFATWVLILGSWVRGGRSNTSWEEILAIWARLKFRGNKARNNDMNACNVEKKN